MAAVAMAAKEAKYHTGTKPSEDQQSNATKLQGLTFLLTDPLSARQLWQLIDQDHRDASPPSSIGATQKQDDIDVLYVKFLHKFHLCILLYLYFEGIFGLQLYEGRTCDRHNKNYF
uniref:Uncharacterized protein n=1 Tax=Oryza punctata TaxID=4537 RepID=A0A0E0KA50_ORYPU